MKQAHRTLRLLAMAALVGWAGPATAEEIILDRLERPGLQVETDGSLTVALDTRIDQELLEEGHAVELKSHINRL